MTTALGDGRRVRIRDPHAVTVGVDRTPARTLIVPVRGAEGQPGTPGPPGADGGSDAPIDPILLFENALA